jgi:hypothetical protein
MIDMKLKTYIVLIGLSLLLLPVWLNSAKYTGEIFQLEPGVANQAMGNTGLTNPEALSATWWNPALLALPGKNGLELMHAEQFEGLMQFNHAAAIFGTQNRIGLTITHIGIDDVKLTRLINEHDTLSATNQPYVWKKVNNNDLMAYLGIGRSIRPNLHLGVSPKLAYRSLAQHNGFGFGADLGLLWEIKSNLSLGCVAKDVISTQVIWENGTWETALPSLQTELGYRTTVLKQAVPIQFAIGIESLFEGRKEAAAVHAGPWSGDFHVGAAIRPIPQVKIMTGYDADAFTAGLGFSISKISLDYAIKLGSEDDLGYSQRISAGWRW